MAAVAALLHGRLVAAVKSFKLRHLALIIPCRAGVEADDAAFECAHLLVGGDRLGTALNVDLHQPFAGLVDILDQRPRLMVDLEVDRDRKYRVEFHFLGRGRGPATRHGTRGKHEGCNTTEKPTMKQHVVILPVESYWLITARPSWLADHLN